MLVGHEDWLIYTGEKSLDDFQNTMPLTEAQLEIIRSKLDSLHEHLGRKGIKLLIVIPPNKNTIYPEKMPVFVPVLHKKSRLDQLMDYQQRHGNARILDLRQALLAGKKEHDVYYATDTHWNPYGAYIGYYEILNALSEHFPTLRPHTLDEYQYVSNGLGTGDFGIKLGQIRVEETFFKLRPLYERPSIKSWTATSEWSSGIVISAQSDESLPSLVMYRDSFANQLMPFLYDHFSRTVLIWSYKVDENFIYSEQPDVVIIEITERNISGLIDIPIDPLQ